MLADPPVGSQVEIDSHRYAFIETPNAPGIVYAEIGKKAKVYRLHHVQNGKYYAFKVFKPRYQNPDTVSNTHKIGEYKHVPGLAVVQRAVITPQQHPDLVAQQKHYTYAVLMPWIEGKSWFNYVMARMPLTRLQSLSLAHALLDVMAGLEDRGLAHCDLSSSNFLFSDEFKTVELIDIEDMFGPGLEQPRDLPIGTSGYAPNWIKQNGLWEAGADRFSTAILLSEILCWQFEDIRAASEGDAFFADAEFGNAGKRFRLMSNRLEELHPLLARLFQTVWYAESVEECPRIADWQQALSPIFEPALRGETAVLDSGIIGQDALQATPPLMELNTSNAGNTEAKTSEGQLDIAPRESQKAATPGKKAPWILSGALVGGGVLFVIFLTLICLVISMTSGRDKVNQTATAFAVANATAEAHSMSVTATNHARIAANTAEVLASQTAAVNATKRAAAQATQAAANNATRTAEAQATRIAATNATRTAAAQATQTATAKIAAAIATVEARTVKIVGPLNGDLNHDPSDDYIEAYSSDVDLKDFIVEAKLYNPYAPSRFWSYGFIFRSESGPNDYRLIIKPSKRWLLTENHSIDDENWVGDVIVEGALQNLRTGAGEANTIRLIAEDNHGWLFVNGEFVSELILSARTNTGDVLVATGLEAGDEKEGAITRYQNFTVWEISQQQDPSAVRILQPTLTDTSRITSSQILPPFINESQLRKDFGPKDGEIAHEIDGLAVYQPEIDRRNFVAEVKFYNPFSTSVGPWSYGITFRQGYWENEYYFRYNANDEYRLFISSDKTWELLNVTPDPFNAKLIMSGKITNLDINEGGSNIFRLVCLNDKGYFYINNVLVSELDLSERTDSGMLGLAIGFYKGHQQSGKVTKFEDFVVWSIK